MRVSEGSLLTADSFALIGRNPKCGCPLAIDNTATADAVRDFEERGLLLEFVPEVCALEIWDRAQFPCPHSLGETHALEGDWGKGAVPPSKEEQPLLRIYRAQDIAS
jgi:hypothetical protein